MKTWRCTTYVHAWEGDAGQGSIPHTHKQSGAHLAWDDLPLFSLFHLPTALGHAHEELMSKSGKAQICLSHPHSASLQAQPNHKPAQVKSCPEPAWGS